jgi:LysM repeat protein
MLYKHLKSKWTCIGIVLLFVFSQSTYAYAASQQYKVEKGDTLYSIAGRFGVTVQELIYTNRISDPRLLQIGQKLQISGSANSANTNTHSNSNKNTSANTTGNKQAAQPVYYQVKAGDTLYVIASNFGITLGDLMRSNRIRDPKLLQIGTRLRIPSANLTADLPTAAAMGGLNYSIEKVLTSTLTAYTAGVESTGKSKDHPEYGITFSGKRVQEGRTIAVDPAVIELGTTVYIEGIGLRTAEDIGSAVKGTRIDVYIEDLEEALEFGVQKNVKVYVLSEPL